MDPWSSSVPSAIIGAAPPLFDYSDPLLSRLLDTKRSLLGGLDDTQEVVGEDEESERKAPSPQFQFFSAVCEGDVVTVEAVAKENPGVVSQTYPEEEGVTPLIFAVAFDHQEVAESLLSSYSVDADVPDGTPIGYSPLMWAVHLRNLPMVKLLLDYQADPQYSPKSDGKNAVSLVTPDDLATYEFFRSHNLLNKDSNRGSEIFESDPFQHDTGDMDSLTHQIRMQTAGLSLDADDDDDNVREKELDEEAELSLDTELVQTPEYDYEKLLPEQYIKFTDSDIPSLLDYIFNLRTDNTSLQHSTKVPAAIVFQLVRYSHFKVHSKDLTEFLFECFLARLRSVTNTKSGVFNMAIAEQSDKAAALGAGDIVLLSYWLSAIQFLHFYFAKANIYHDYPAFLQEFVNINQSLIATLSFSINSRLNLLVDECLLKFTNLVDVSSVLYAKDWNFFKNKTNIKDQPSTYDDILDMLYPPTMKELMKPSPLKYVQVLGALDYVLKLHEVDPLLRLQTYSQVFYYINATIFNRLVANSKYCSRAKAIQIRLNVSTLEDWLRSHNYSIYKPEKAGGLIELLKPEEGGHQLRLHNLLDESPQTDGSVADTKNPHCLAFYYRSLYHIGKSQLMPTIELLQWLQCMSALKDEESLINTINQFDTLNYYQLFKVANKLYRYEVEETKLPKPLLQYLKRLMNEHGEKQIERSLLHYMTQSTFLSKELYIYLNPNFIFSVGLPNLNELIVRYGAGLGGIKSLRAKKFQPTLPVTVLDDVDDILTKNKESNMNDTYDYEEHTDDEAEEEEPVQTSNGDDIDERPAVDGNSKSFKGDELFKTVQVPSSLVHRNWGDNDENPW
ncbi:hypothetical protein CXQ85_004141 [Candidozyma haemuli]|uniref:Dilute domain-containing protein n=1 Tax=Candidozyma haemuli TaxID=45357 RepID=A0A2V1B0L4_9ASCO|nr:hypothetical protein CXQ85_004141 [[Candida] haemuloni]PVH23847.1 hypothetical protein CXQ85_004141 [[Candida] haemuloni]